MILVLELQKVTWHLPLKLGEVVWDRRHVEACEDRFLRLAVEQKPEGRLEAVLRRMLARREPLTHLLRHRDVVTSLTLSFADDHFENERVMFGSAPDLNHVDLLGDARVLKGYIRHWIPYTRLTSGKPDLRIRAHASIRHVRPPGRRVKSDENRAPRAHEILRIP